MQVNWPYLFSNAVARLVQRWYYCTITDDKKAKYKIKGLAFHQKD